jgi:ribonuclease P protein component
VLAPAARLRRRDDFTRTVRAGRRAGRGSVVVHCLLPVDVADGPARVGFVVSKAIGNAVTRNLVVRRLRHLARPRLAGLPTGAMVVVRALPSSATLTFDRLGDDLDAALDASLAKAAKPREADRPSGSAGAATGQVQL